MKHLLELTARSAILGYKNFFHWTLLRVIIVIGSGLLTFVGVIPFIIVTYLYSLTNEFPWSIFVKEFLSGTISRGVTDQISDYIFWFIGGIILIGITLLIAYILFGFSRVLLISVGLEYNKKEKSLSSIKKLTSISTVWLYLKYSLLRSILLVIPVLVFGLFSLVIIFAYG
jgi:hypothetical protein